MLIYIIDSKTREYMRSEEWTPPAPWVALPSAASTMAPPAPQAGYASVLNAAGDAWRQVEDHRGAAGFINGEPYTITELGALPQDWSDEAPLVPLDEIRAAKQSEIRDQAEAILAPLKREYCETEIATWDQQAAQADALVADPDAAAPMVRAIASNRGMDPVELAQRIIANKAAWEVVSGTVIGQRLAYQDRLDATEDITDEDEARAAVAAIVVSYTLPEGA
ncbi:hypothetical protein dsx2_2507 [Desulfovibrio sp. X2]|uniref:hypothetical protein n=1 Tax=Desulfovibrio sp. X2 TaxID=941449 RepID=UPI0003589531|nr:hypothetical protein [Desulfovibrio sp. X2]EPR43147.1 hypothetical protein dsx2_2507 [Desulfovibrio sp. X2]